jgi:hypothetical protein
MLILAVIDFGDASKKTDTRLPEVYSDSTLVGAMDRCALDENRSNWDRSLTARGNLRMSALGH